MGSSTFCSNRNPISFYEERGYNLGLSGLPFIPIGIGVILGSGIIAWYTQTTIKANFARDGKMTPEDRLVPMIIGAAFLPIGCFWYAWTSAPNISPWPQIISGVPIGMGLQNGLPPGSLLTSSMFI